MRADRPYLATAGGAPISELAAAAGRRYYDETLATSDAGSGNWLAELDGVRGQVAGILGARVNQIGFVVHASAALNIPAF